MLLTRKDRLMAYLSETPCPAPGCGSYERRPRGNCAACHRRAAKRYRERKKAAEGSHTEVEWLAKATTYDRCPRCQRSWDEVERPNGQKLPFTKGHIIALAKGGTNCLSNVQPECARCNYSDHGARPRRLH